MIFSSPSTNNCLLSVQFCDITTEIDIQRREELFAIKVESILKFLIISNNMNYNSSDCRWRKHTEKLRNKSRRQALMCRITVSGALTVIPKKKKEKKPGVLILLQLSLVVYV